MADPRIIDQVGYLLGVVHNLEHAANQVTNICERAFFPGLEEGERDGCGVGCGLFDPGEQRKVLEGDTGNKHGCTGSC